jgi:hypothetical protein
MAAVTRLGVRDSAIESARSLHHTLAMEHPLPPHVQRRLTSSPSRTVAAPAARRESVRELLLRGGGSAPLAGSWVLHGWLFLHPSPPLPPPTTCDASRRAALGLAPCSRHTGPASYRAVADLEPGSELHAPAAGSTAFSLVRPASPVQMRRPLDNLDIVTESCDINASRGPWQPVSSLLQLSSG